MTRKLVALLLTLALALSVAACAQADTGTDAVKITFWHSMSDKAGTLVDKYVSDFNAGPGKELGIEVEAVFQGKYSDSTTKMNSIINAEQFADLPDVMNLDATGKISYFNSGAAYTIDDALKADAEFDISKMLPSALGNWNFAGTQLGLPFAASTTVLFYNKTLLDAAGVAAPETFADIIAVAAALPDKTADGADLVVYSAVPNTPTLANWLGQLGSYVVNNMNGSEATATELDCLDNGALATFLTEWKAMYQAGALANVDGTSDSFVAGQLALYTTSSSNVTTLLEKIGGAFELGVGYYPKVNADASFGATVSGSCVAMFDKGDEAKKAAAWEFVKYLTSADVQADFAINTGYTPCNTASAETEAYKALIAEYPQYNVAVEQLAVTPTDMRSVTVGPSIDFYYAIQDCVTSMLDEDWAIDEAVDTMTDELNGLLYQYNQANQ